MSLWLMAAMVEAGSSSGLDSSLQGWRGAQRRPQGTWQSWGDRRPSACTVMGLLQVWELCLSLFQQSDECGDIRPVEPS